jgi:hypothetical protein
MRASGTRESTGMCAAGAVVVAFVGGPWRSAAAVRGSVASGIIAGGSGASGSDGGAGIVVLVCAAATAASARARRRAARSAARSSAVGSLGVAEDASPGAAVVADVLGSVLRLRGVRTGATGVSAVEDSEDAAGSAVGCVATVLVVVGVGLRRFLTAVVSSGGAPAVAGIVTCPSLGRGSQTAAREAASGTGVAIVESDKGTAGASDSAGTRGSVSAAEVDTLAGTRSGAADGGAAAVVAVGARAPGLARPSVTVASGASLGTCGSKCMGGAGGAVVLACADSGWGTAGRPLDGAVGWRASASRDA